MVTDGRFSSLFACLTWKCRPMERLLATPLQAAQDGPQHLPQMRCTCWNRAPTLPNPPQAMLSKWSSLEGGCGCQEREPSNRPRNYLRLLANSLYKLVNNLLHFWSPVQLLFFEAFPGFSLPLILQPPFMLEHRHPFGRKSCRCTSDLH